MKTKKSTVTFYCDFCEKSNLEREESIGGISIENDVFPYDKGWAYIYNFSLKIYAIEQTIQDKHFCSKTCFEKYLKKIVKEYYEVINKDA